MVSASHARAEALTLLKVLPVIIPIRRLAVYHDALLEPSLSGLPV
jgi:hypothetical protein